MVNTDTQDDDFWERLQSSERKECNEPGRAGFEENRAPQVERVRREPPRKQKAFYIQEWHSEAFEILAFKQKRTTGKRAPELAEEAIELLLEKYSDELKLN